MSAHRFVLNLNNQSGSGRGGGPSLMETYIDHRLVVRSESDNISWTDGTERWI